MTTFSRGLILKPRWWLAKWFAAAVLALGIFYSLGTTAIFLWVRHEGLRNLHWLDIALPSRWSGLPTARGDRQLAQAYAYARSGRVREAMAFARSGIAKSPANRDGRLLYAQLLSLPSPLAAQDLLLDGLRHHRGDSSYLASLFPFLLQRQEDARVIDLTRELLRDPLLPAAAGRVAAHSAATACFLRGNYDEAEDFLRTTAGLLDSRDGRLLAAKIDWERGFRALALGELRTLTRAFPADAEIYTELVRQLRQLGRSDQARRATLAFQIAHPQLAAPRIDLLRAYRELGDFTRLASESDALLRDFSTDPSTLATIGDFAAESGDVLLAQRVAELARQRNFPNEPYAFLLVETMIVARDYAGAFATIDRLTAENPDWTHFHQPLLDSLRAVAALGQGDIEASRLFLAHFLQQPGLRAENLLALANRFTALDAGSQVYDVLARATAADPLNQAALTRLVELELNLNRIDDLPAHLSRLLTMRRISPDILRVAQHKLGSDVFLFSVERAPALDAIAAALERTRATARFSAQFPPIP